MAESFRENDYFDQLTVCFAASRQGLHSSRNLKRTRLRIGLMTGTEVKRTDKNGEIRLKCPFVFFSFRNQSYSWITEGNVSRDSFFFDLEGSRADELERTLKHDFPDGTASISDPVPFQQILEQMHELFFQHRQEHRYRLPVLAEEFVARIYIEQAAAQSPNKYVRKILQDADEVNRAPGGEHDFMRKAAVLGITPVHYRRIFKAVIGMAPYQYLQQCRLSHAIRLLRNEKQLQIQQIAAECGFGNATEFSRFFKKQTGLSPLNYSKNFFE